MEWLFQRKTDRDNSFANSQKYTFCLLLLKRKMRCIAPKSSIDSFCCFVPSSSWVLGWLGVGLALACHSRRFRFFLSQNRDGKWNESFRRTIFFLFHPCSMIIIMCKDIRSYTSFFFCSFFNVAILHKCAMLDAFSHWRINIGDETSSVIHIGIYWNRVRFKRIFKNS